MSNSDRDDEEVTEEPTEAAKPTTMLRREQQIGYLLAGLGAASSVSAATAGHEPALGVAGLAATVLLLLAVRKGHRIMSALAAFLTGVTVSTYFVPFELVMMFFGLYLVWRTTGAQQKQRLAHPPMAAAQRREAAAARAAARTARRKGTPAVTPAVTKTPPPNRRYTPPKNRPSSPRPQNKGG